MSKKLKRLTEAEYWKIIQKFYDAQHKFGTKKSLDYKDEKYSTKSGEPRKETIMNDLNEQQKQFKSFIIVSFLGSPDFV